MADLEAGSRLGCGGIRPCLSVPRAARPGSPVRGRGWSKASLSSDTMARGRFLPLRGGQGATLLALCLPEACA